MTLPNKLARTTSFTRATLASTMTVPLSVSQTSESSIGLESAPMPFRGDASLIGPSEPRTLRHVAQYSPLLSEKIRLEIQQTGQQQPPVKQRYPPDQLPLSELPSFINKTYTLDVPVYTVWGACEDVRVLEKFRSGEYKVDKLNIIDEANSRLLDVGGVKLRLFGLGGAVVMHKLFDNGEGRTTIAGGQGTMWTTLLQMGELVDTANRVYDPTETRIFVTHASPAREGLLNQLSVALKADFSISAGLHFRYGSSYNEFSVNPTLDHYRGKLAASKASFNDVWETVKGEVEPAVAQNEAQQMLLHNALDIVQKMPSVANGGNPFGGPVTGPNAGGQVDEGAFKTMWNFNLADAAFGYLVLEVESGRIGTEMKAQGFNFAHRGGRHGPTQMQQLTAAPAAGSGAPHEKTSLPSAPPTASDQNQPHAAAGGPPRQPPAQQPRNAPESAQQQQGRPPTGPGRSTQSPAPSRNSQPSPAVRNNNQSPAPSGAQSGKPPAQAPGANVNLPTTAAAPDTSATPLQSQDVRNGTGSNDAKRSDSPGAPKIHSPTERKPVTALFVAFVKDEEACRALFPDEDREKIVRVERMKSGAHIVHFNSAEEAKAVLDRQPADNKRRGEHGHPSMKIFHDRPHTYGQGGEGGAGRWQGSNRGGNNTSGQGGYKSGGASDSEGGRGGRGGYRGGPRSRGERGRGGRGPTGGRGSFNNKGGQGSESGGAPASTGTSAGGPPPSGDS